MRSADEPHTAPRCAQQAHLVTDKIVEQRTQPRNGILATEQQERREALLEHVRRDGLSGYALLGAD